MGRNNGFNRGCGCNNHRGHREEEFEIRESRNEDRFCDCRELFEGVTRNSCVKLFLKGSTTITGNFVGIFGNIVTLFDCDRHGRVSTKTICCNDVQAVVQISENEDCHNESSSSRH